MPGGQERNENEMKGTPSKEPSAISSTTPRSSTQRAPQCAEVLQAAAELQNVTQPRKQKSCACHSRGVLLPKETKGRQFRIRGRVLGSGPACVIDLSRMGPTAIDFGDRLVWTPLTVEVVRSDGSIAEGRRIRVWQLGGAFRVPGTDLISKTTYTTTWGQTKVRTEAEMLLHRFLPDHPEKAGYWLVNAWNNLGPGTFGDGQLNSNILPCRGYWKHPGIEALPLNHCARWGGTLSFGFDKKLRDAVPNSESWDWVYSSIRIAGEAWLNAMSQQIGDYPITKQNPIKVLFHDKGNEYPIDFDPANGAVADIGVALADLKGYIDGAGLLATVNALYKEDKYFYTRTNVKAHQLHRAVIGLNKAIEWPDYTAELKDWPKKGWDGETGPDLFGLMKHEFGHFFGLNHREKICREHLLAVYQDDVAWGPVAMFRPSNPPQFYNIKKASRWWRGYSIGSSKDDKVRIRLLYPQYNLVGGFDQDLVTHALWKQGSETIVTEPGNSPQRVPIGNCEALGDGEWDGEGG